MQQQRPLLLFRPLNFCQSNGILLWPNKFGPIKKSILYLLYALCTIFYSSTTAQDIPFSERFFPTQIDSLKLALIDLQNGDDWYLTRQSASTNNKFHIDPLTTSGGDESYSYEFSDG